MNNVIKNLKRYSYFYLLGIATAYAIFYSIYSFSETVNNNLVLYDNIISYFADVSILFFTAGIFSVSMKYFQFLGVFEKEFKKVISSKDFDDKLEKQLKQITFSEDFLIEQSNLSELWETVTLCKYRQQFPNLYPKLKKKIYNELFITDNISYYYKNIQLNYYVELIDEHYVKVTETASLTIVRPNTKEFEWDFGVTYLKNEDENITYDLFYDITNIKGIEFDTNDIKEEPIGDFKIKKYISKKLHGQLEYHVERRIILVQDLRHDREFSFGSDRIIDDINLKIKHCDKLCVYFTPVNKNIMYPNGAYPREDNAYINRDIFLAGEKFKIFIYKK